jgi:lysophospholipase L1-like esterase
MPCARRLLAGVVVLLVALGAMAVSAAACGGGGGGGAEPTTLTTSLSGEGKEGETITVLEGSAVKDKATLSGTNSSSATGKVTYDVYSESACKTLVKAAGEVTVSGKSVPASSEETPTAGASYYWQATYSGDSKNSGSVSACTEIETIKANTSLSTKLSGESKEGETITVLEGSGVKDKATLTGTNVSSATGTVKYHIYSESKCETSVKAAGEATVSGEVVPASSEETPEAGASYYWQATYNGDSLHQASTSPCTEIENIQAKTTLSTSLAGEESSGEEIEVQEELPVVDNATLHGEHLASATGTVKYKIYSDSECKTLVAEAGEVTVSEGSVPESSEETLAPGTYYWQAAYSGDSTHQASTSPCGKEVLIVKAATSLTTSLLGEGVEAAEVTVAEGAAVSDTATLSGPDAAMATGTVKYNVYSDIECKELVTAAGEATVSGEFVPKSSEETLPVGTYYWQAVYSGNSVNHSSKSACGSEVEVVTPTITTSLTSEGKEGEEVEVLEGSGVSDKATLHGEHASIATGTVKYKIYSDSECKELVTAAGEVTVSGASVPASSEQTLPAGTYYWQADYSGDAHNPAGESACGSEVSVVQTSTTLTTSLAGEAHTGSEITVQEESPVSDKATLSGTNASTAGGYVKYAVYSDSECKELVAEAGEVSVSGGSVPESGEETLPVGTYYWQATYSGDGLNHSSTSTCGSEISVVTAPVTTSLSGGEQSGGVIEVPEETAVSDKATLHGEHASIATGTVKYEIYSDSECKELVTSAGEVTVSGASVPASSEETLPAGIYYWQAEYSGDAHNPAAKSACGTEMQEVLQSGWKYAAIGDSFSSGEGIGNYYPETNRSARVRPRGNENYCHRSETAYPARLASKFFGAGSVARAEVFRQQPSRFIFRACSGAVTQNLWSTLATPATEGQYNEWIEGAPGRWLRKPAQGLWLQEPGGTPPMMPITPNNNIRRVTLTIGGNDAGFATILRNCMRPNVPIPDLVAVPLRKRCKEIINEWATGVPGTPKTLMIPSPTKQEGIPSIVTKLPVVLKNIRESAPRARIFLLLYPQGLNTAVNGRISVGGGAAIENAIPRATQSVAVALERFTNALNRTVQTTFEAWQRAERANAEVIAGTVNAFRGHRLGNAVPWLNGLVLVWFEESFHPNCKGHIALAEQVLRQLREAAGGWAC